MSKIIGLLRKGNFSQKKIYDEYIQIQKSDIPYKKFKRESIELLELKKYVQHMDEYDYLTKKEVNNIFKYLTNNLKYSKYSNVKNIIVILNDIKDILLNKISSLKENEQDIFNSLKHLLFHVELLKELIANKFNMTYQELDKTIRFEKLIQIIINKNSINNSEKILMLIFDNIELLNHHDYKGRTFSTLLYEAILNSKLNNHSASLTYYRKIVNFILNVKSLNIDKEKIMEVLEINMNDFQFEYGSALDDKIFDLKFDEKTGRYILKDDYIISIDNDDTRKIDDALSIETTSYGTYILGIHITDVYSLGIIASELSYHNKNHDSINKIKASLEEFQKKNAISLFVEITSQGIIKNYRMLKTRIEVDRNLLYDDVSKLLYDKSINPELSETLSNLVNLYNIVENNKFPKYPNIGTVSHLIVKKFMLLYGCIISEFFYTNNIPGIYLDGSENIYSIEKSKYDAGFDKFDTYSKSTSPIYDRSSLLCQYIIHTCIFRSVSNIEKQRLHYILEPIIKDMNKKRDK